MENVIKISEAFLRDVLKQNKFKFTLNEIDSIISPELKKDIVDKICLDFENRDSNQG